MRIIIFLCLVLVGSAVNVGATWKAATAKVVITSNKPLWMIGYSNDVVGYISSLRVPREVGCEGWRQHALHP